MPGGKHLTVDRDLKLAILWLESLSQVKRVILGESRGFSHSKPQGSFRIRSRTPAGISLDGYGNNGVTRVFVQTKHPDEVAELIRHRLASPVGPRAASPGGP